MFACHSDDDLPESLYHSPTGEVIVKVADTAIVVDFSLDEDMKNAMASSYKMPDVKTREDLISHYKTLRPHFLPVYLFSSSRSDTTDHHFAKVEYWLAQECFQSDCSSETRREVLTMAVEKQKKIYVFNPPFYSFPYYSSRTGVFLIALILLIEGDHSFIQSLAHDVDMQKTLLCLNNNIWIYKKQSDKLVQYAEDFLSNQ